MIRISGRAIARLVALIAGADFLGDDFGQREANDFRGAKGNCLKKLRSHWSRRSVASVDVSRRLSAGNLAFPASIPHMATSGIDPPGQPVLRLVVAVVRNGELDAVKGLFVRASKCPNVSVLWFLL
jgi:hypothetical protein